VLEQIAQDRLALEHGLEALAERVVEAGRASGETLDAAGRQAAEDARRTRQALAEALETLHGALSATLREMRELHEQAVRELRRPLRQAVAIQQEIRRARGQHAHGTAGEGASALDATSRAIASRPPEAEVPGTPAVHPPRQEEPIQRPPQTAAPRPRRLAELLGRVQRRTLGSPARTDGRARP
jgi:ABC-type transporter Mla subunit MlaD